jgi:hypothetical protein
MREVRIAGLIPMRNTQRRYDEPSRHHRPRMNKVASMHCSPLPQLRIAPNSDWQF